MADSSEKYKFSIIICTYNREKLLPLALASILQQTLDPNSFELILIDNNSSDSTPQIYRDFCSKNKQINTAYFVESKQGLSYARNRGILEAQGDIITFMDDDALLSPDFCERCVDFFAKHPEVNAAGGIILLKFMNNKPYWHNPFLSSLLGYFNPGKKEKPFRRTYFRGSNMSFRLSLFETFDPFNTELGRVGKNMAGSEEKEIFYRLRDANEEIWFTPQAVVHHLVPEERCGVDFIKQQGIGAGKSQRQMVLIKGRIALVKSFLSELIKWFISLIIALFYILTIRPRIGIILLRFRFWISSGLFSGSSR